MASRGYPLVIARARCCAAGLPQSEMAPAPTMHRGLSRGGYLWDAP
jgi:hypothetical protein